MKSLFLSVALIGLVASACPAVAAPSAKAHPAKPHRDRQPSTAPNLSGAMKMAIAAGPAKACKPGPIAVAAEGSWAGSIGDDTPLTFPSVDTDEGGAWDTNPSFSSFTAPCAGLYHLSVGFTRDGYPHADRKCGGQGTQNDVFVYLTVDGAPLRMRQAWTGEGDGGRATASSDTVTRLQKGQTIMFWVQSDGGPRRCLAQYSFTGFKISD